MAIEKNITMKQFNGTDYDTLYPKTIASQIPDVYSKSYIDSILKDSARIQIGSYVGTGTYGSDNPCTLTFDFTPLIFGIRKLNDTPDLFCYLYNQSNNANIPYFSDDGQAFIAYNKTGYTFVRMPQNNRLYIKSTGNTIQYRVSYTYQEDGAIYQMNESNITYEYFGIG